MTPVISMVTNIFVSLRENGTLEIKLTFPEIFEYLYKNSDSI